MTIGQIVVQRNRTSGRHRAQSREAAIGNNAGVPVTATQILGTISSKQTSAHNSTTTTAVESINTEGATLSQSVQTVPLLPGAGISLTSSLLAATHTNSDSSHSTTTVQPWTIEVIVGLLVVLVLIAITGIIIFRRRRQRLSIHNVNPSPYGIDHNEDLQQITIPNNFTPANEKGTFDVRGPMGGPLFPATARETGGQEPEGTAIIDISTRLSGPLGYHINLARTLVYSVDRSTPPPSYQEVQDN